MVLHKHFLCVFCVLGGLSLAGCGRKGPPLPPIVRLPAPVADLTVKRLGDTVVLQFTVPSTNTDGSRPADLDRVEIYAHTGPLVTPADFLKYGTLIGNVAVKPAAGAAVGAPQPGVEQGAKATVSETIGAAQLQPGKIPATRVSTNPAAAARTYTDLETEGTVNAPTETIRFYVAVGVSRRNHRGAFSPRVALALAAPLSAPGTVQAKVAEKGVTLAWDSVARGEDMFAPTPLYNVYEVDDPSEASRVDAGPVAGAPTVSSTPFRTPVNPAPLTEPTFADPRTDFGRRRCYEVRTIRREAGISIESEPTPLTCVDLVDTFPPAPPKSLAAVASDGSINLIWEPNTEKDLAGYLVLRGESADGSLSPLTKEPIQETTYRDTTVRPGVTYVYAVVAVDNAPTPNTSEYSNRVTEVAR